jgi:hypothetical protein
MTKAKLIDFDQRPKDEEGRTMVRRIRMHEFLMDGGVVTGRDKHGHVTYSGPITVVEYPVCPWHGEGCEAWTEIAEGRGEWTRLEAELAELQAESENLAAGFGERDEMLADRIAALEAKLEMRPRSVRQLRERTDEEIAAERAAFIQRQHPSVYAPAPRQGTGNPWDRKSEPHSSYVDYSDHQPKYHAPAPKSRDVVAAALSDESLPDEIEIDGTEGEEGEEGEEE